MAIPLIGANQRRLTVSLNSWLTIVVSHPVHSFAPIRLPLNCRLGVFASLREAPPRPFVIRHSPRSKPVKVRIFNPLYKPL